MICPKCSDVTLVMSEPQGIEIDYCPKCRGAWLERSELDVILKHKKSATNVVSIPSVASQKDMGSQVTYEGPMEVLANNVPIKSLV